MTDPYAMGPPRHYVPPDPLDLTSPEHHRSVRDRGRDKCLAALAEAGITRDERGKWHTKTETEETTK